MVLRSECSRQADRSSAKAIQNPKTIRQSPVGPVPIFTLVRRTYIAGVTCRCRERALGVNQLESTWRGISRSLVKVTHDQARIDRNWIWRWRGATHVEPVLETTWTELSLSTQQPLMLINAIVKMIQSHSSLPFAQGLAPPNLLFASLLIHLRYRPPLTCQFREPIPIQSARAVGTVGLVIGCLAWTGSGGVRWQKVSL